MVGRGRNAAHNNLAEQGLRPHIAKKGKLSWGWRRRGGGKQFAALRACPDGEDAWRGAPRARRSSDERSAGSLRVRWGSPALNSDESTIHHESSGEGARYTQA